MLSNSSEPSASARTSSDMPAARSMADADAAGDEEEEEAEAEAAEPSVQINYDRVEGERVWCGGADLRFPVRYMLPHITFQSFHVGGGDVSGAAIVPLSIRVQRVQFDAPSRIRRHDVFGLVAMNVSVVWSVVAVPPGASIDKINY